jgi:hypothetical protein
MMKALLATTAAVALAAGMSIAAAQGTGGTPGASGGTGAGGGASHGTMEKQSGTEKGGRGGSEKMGQKPGEKGERTGQKAGEKNERTGQKAGEKNEQMGQKPGEKNERTGERAGGTTTTERSGSSSERISQAKSVHLSSEQRTRITTVVTSHREARVDHVDFSIRVGVRVPHTVHIVALPEEIVTIVPQYRGFYYVIVRNEILIIDPDTYEIVAVLPA